MGSSSRPGSRNKFIQRKALALAIGGSMALAFSANALAFNPYTNGVVYFDENGQVVGQQVLTCEGRQWHGGNIHTAYHVSTHALCGWPCPPPGNQTQPDHCPQPSNSIVPGTLVIQYVLPSFETIQQACSLMDGQCEVPPERMLGNGWTWLGGWR